MKTITRIVKNLLQNYAVATKTYTFGVVALTLVGGLTAGVSSSLDDEVPIRLAAIAAVEANSLNDIEGEVEENSEEEVVEEVALKRVATIEPQAEFKNEVPYVSALYDPEIEMHVYTYFADIPEMIYVAQCESSFRHYGRNGEVLRGIEVSADVGVMQINEYYHLTTSRGLGYDIHTLEGNLDYARHLYEKQGLQPWSASRPCWAPKHAAAQL